MKNKLKISADSWHCKMLSIFDLEVGVTNLCQYIRRCIGVAGMLLIMGLFALLLIVIWAITPILIVQYFFDIPLITTSWFYDQRFIILSTVLNLVIDTSLIYYFIHNYIKNKAPDSVVIKGIQLEEGSMTNLATEWIKAKHDKVCPIIDIDYIERNK